MRVPTILDDTTASLFKAIKDIQIALANRLSLSDNSQVSFVAFTFTTLNTNYDIKHTLGHIPTYFTAEPETAVIVFASSANRSAWTATTIRLQCNTSASTVHLVIG